MPDLTGAEIRKRYETGGIPDAVIAAPTAPMSGADIRSAFPAADQQTTPPPPPAVQETAGIDPAALAAPALQAPVTRVLDAAAEGWQGIPAIPRVPSNLVLSPIYNPLLAGVETAFRGGAAILRGGQQAVVEATPNISLPPLPPGVTIPLGGGRSLSGELTPGPLGREIAALPEAFPTGINYLRPPMRPAIPEAPPPPPLQAGLGSRPPFVPPSGAEAPAPYPPPPEPQRPAFVPPSGAEAPNYLKIGPDGKPLPAEPQGAPSQPPSNVPNALEAPQAGAAPVQPPTSTIPAPRFMPITTEAQASAEADRILRHFAGNTPVNIDTSTPGLTLSQAITGGNPGVAALERSVRDVPPLGNEHIAQETALRDSRAGQMLDIQKTEPELRSLEAQSKALADKEDPQVFNATNKPVPTAPTIKVIDDILAGREGQRDVVASALTNIRAKLVKLTQADGTADPNLMYGVDKAIRDSIAPKAAGTASDYRQAAHELMTVQDTLRPSIETGAPGFQAMMAARASRLSEIDGMTYLQNMRLTDSGGHTTLPKLDAAIKTLERQQNMPGARMADGVTPEQLDQLKALREHFRLDAKKLLGMPVNSSTVQKFGTNAIVANLGHPLVNLATTGGMIANPWVGVPLAIAKWGLERSSVQGRDMVLRALNRKLLNPDEARSAFAPPGAPTRP